MPEKYIWPFPEESSRYKTVWKYCSLALGGTVGVLSKLWLSKFNSLEIHNGEKLFEAVHNRSKDTSLITVANHFSCMDDPLLWGCLKWKTLFRPSKLRWILGAHDICFTTKTHGLFFALGRVVPVVRGDGVYQRGVDFIIKRLNEGGWCNLFPEGRVNMDKKWIRFKWGVGRMVYECEKRVVVLPLYHFGIDNVLPNQKPYIPRIGNHVTVVVGDPIEFQENIKVWKSKGWTETDIRKEITAKIQVELDSLRIKAEEIHNQRLKHS